MTTKTIILDLDDTIFQTKSMDAKIFEPFFNHLILKLKTNFDQQIIERIVSDLWQRPFDIVIKKYNIPFTTIAESIDLLENLDLYLKISTFQDYTFIKNIQTKKLLVTTGLTALQKAKIKALKIENDFDKIIINDTLKETKTKQDIFYELKLEFKLNPETTYVIGDNPESEIKAGNALNFTTIQILRENVIRGNNARHYINSFDELGLIIN
ncbi:MAG: HAD family hydrolase [Flavobacteriales bacterium]|nr:HAD family hydrolase [Bacteroidota bacterium]